MRSQIQIKFEPVSVFVSGRKNCYHPIEQKAFLCLVSPTQRALVCSSQVLIQLNHFPFTTAYRVRTSYLSRGGSWNFRTSSKGGSGHFSPLR